MLKDNGQIIFSLYRYFLLLQQIISLHGDSRSSGHDTLMLILNGQAALSVFQIGALHGLGYDSRIDKRIFINPLLIRDNHGQHSFRNAKLYSGDSHRRTKILFLCNFCIL